MTKSTLIRKRYLLIAVAIAAVSLVGCQVSTPTFDPVDGSDLSSAGPMVTETISCDTTGAIIYYTLDGSTPTDASTLYSGPFDFSISHPPDEVITAIAVKAGWTDSEVGTATYTWIW